MSFDMVIHNWTNEIYHNLNGELRGKDTYLIQVHAIRGYPEP